MNTPPIPVRSTRSQRHSKSGKLLLLTAMLIGIGACSDSPLSTVQNKFAEAPPASGPPVLPIFASVHTSGVETYTQVINSGGGFGQYVYWQGSFGWQHSFSLWNTPGVTITSAKLMIQAYDVDSEPFHGTRGEYDAIYVDGTRLNPGFLQGANNAWTTTTFDVPVGAITDDGNVNTYVDIDINTRGNWATQVGSSTLVITYTTGPVNGAPFQPTLVAPLVAPSIADGLSITVTGPTPADPDGDAVTYEYRWFLNTGNLIQLSGTISQINQNNGTFVLQTQNGNVTVALPYNPPAATVNYFRQLRNGNTVKVEATQVGTNRVEIYRFL